MNKQMKNLLLVACVPLLMTSCVAKRKFVASQQQVSSLQDDSLRLEKKIAGLQNDVAGLQKNLADLNQKMEASNKAAAGTIASQQNALQKSEQELADRQRKLESLQSLLEQQKKNADALRQKMADALVKFNSNELSVSVKNGKVYVSLQENLLFPSGSATVNAKGKEALGKLAEVLNANHDITVNIEGHTDSIPIRTRFEDNWALSTARASSIVRILTKDYQVDPVRVVASGHSQYDPVEANSTPEGRAKNRRTEIILSPKLDELYKLING
ncbi:OmpA family protein [Paraflavitalea pollutisoli]|uniref:OmpA family protein n=1 Tax=Paraflavitalea pollutisoli TaxID=3034143 RepID=UPI0023EC2F1E|nr:OmpA family protein [Paraflavitalea sp. H1-2-19X]